MASMLDKYGVPLPSGRNRTMSQPKLKHKFRVVVYNFGTDIDEKDYIALEVDQVDRPSVTFDVHQLNNFDGNTKYFGKHNWKPITLTIRDAVNNNAAKAVIRQLQKQLDFQRRIGTRSAQKTAGYKFRMMIETTNGANPDDTMTQFIHDTALDVGEAITNNPGLINAIDKFVKPSGYDGVGTLDRWVCFGCLISDISWDTLDYSSSQYVTVKLTIEVDNCVQYDILSEMYDTHVDSLLPDDINNGLDVIDQLFKR